MATINTGSHPKELWPGVKKIFGKGYAEKPEVFMQVFDKTTSDKAYEEYVEQTGFGLAPVKSEGGAISYDTDGQGYISRLTNTVYALGAKVSLEAIRYNQYEAVAKSKAKKLGRSMRHTKENVHANVLNRAFSGSYLGGDGVALLSNAHPTVDGTQSNILSVAADLSEAALEDMLTMIRGMTDSRGLKIQATGQKLILPPQLEFDATRILQSTLQPGTANNDLNAIKSMGMLPGGMVVWDYLTDPDAWFIKTDVDDGLITQQAWDREFDQDNDFDTKNACMAAMEAYTCGWADWRGVVGTPGA